MKIVDPALTRLGSFGTISPTGDITSNLARFEPQFLAEILHRKCLAFCEGATIDPVTGGDVCVGYAVSVPNAELRVAGGPSKDVIAAWLRTHALPIIAAEEGLGRAGYIGLWRADGKWYFDVSVIEVTEADARANAIRWKQVAFYDLTNGKTIYTDQPAEAEIPVNLN